MRTVPGDRSSPLLLAVSALPWLPFVGSFARLLGYRGEALMVVSYRASGPAYGARWSSRLSFAWGRVAWSARLVLGLVARALLAALALW